MFGKWLTEGSLGNYPSPLTPDRGIGTVLLRTENSRRSASQRATWSEWLLFGMMSVVVAEVSLSL